MSVRIPLKSLTKEQARLIEKVLTIEKNIPPHMRKKFYSAAPETIRFFHVDGDDLVLPFAAGNGLLKSFPNDDLPHPETSIEFTGELRPAQEEVVEKAVELLNSKRAVLLALCTGFGKTIIGAYLASLMGLKVCVLYHLTNLGPQWAKTFQDVTDGKVWTVGEKKQTYTPDVNVILCMRTRVEKIPEEVRKEVGVLIVDEAHCFCTPQAPSIFLSFQPRYVIMETATPKRADGLDKILTALGSSNLISEPTEGGSADPVIQKINTKPFDVYKVTTGIKLEISTNPDGTIRWDDYLKKYTTNPVRNQMLVEVADIFPEKKILYLTERTEHVTFLEQAFINKKIPVATMYGTKTSYEDTRILIGNISKVGVGFDQASACLDFGGVRIDLVVICVSIKSLTRLEQCVGRGLRADYPTILHFVDSHDLAKSHWRGCNKWYPSRAGTVYEVSFNDLAVPRRNRILLNQEILMAYEEASKV